MLKQEYSVEQRQYHGPLTRYAKLRVVHEPRMPGERFFRHRLRRKPLVSDPGMHHGTCVTHMPWCISGSLTRGGGENVPGISGAYATRNFTYLARGSWLPIPTPIASPGHQNLCYWFRCVYFVISWHKILNLALLQRWEMTENANTFLRFLRACEHIRGSPFEVARCIHAPVI